ncbi:MAG: acetyl-CoA carboxylase carboxyltransferase subunit beta [Candidatus Omnitrophica bacterium]|nr:acetyl-CoA carboxylase carboxyltransferase subunit beta [Candidatus Omnitrophota bacterium]
MAWFRKKKKFTNLNTKEKKIDIPKGIWRKCDACEQYITTEEIKRNLFICPRCNYYYVLPVEDRIASILDEGSFEEFDAALASKNPLDFEGYQQKLQNAQKKTGRYEAAVNGIGAVGGLPVIVCVLDFSFMGGSMGSVVGEKITRAAERALNDEIPLVIISTGGGGARMHEGMLSLMQMAKTSASIGRLKKHGIPYISIIANPTMGGVAASFAALGDVIIAEPNALIGFAGPRVIEQTIGQRLPDGFQRAEFLLQHGMIDRIVDRKEIVNELKPLLRHMFYNQSAMRNQESNSSPKLYAVRKT